MGAGTRKKHKFAPYPKGHNFQNSCVKCGRVKTDPIHKQKPNADKQ